jgi:hypothetical protein
MNTRVLLFAEYADMGGTRTYAKQLISFYVKNQFNVTFCARGPINDADMETYCKDAGITFIHYNQVVLFINRFNKLPLQTLLEFISNFFFSRIIQTRSNCCYSYKSRCVFWAFPFKEKVYIHTTHNS